jgi:hypothetical protein
MRKRRNLGEKVVAVVMYAFWAAFFVALLAYALAQMAHC